MAKPKSKRGKKAGQQAKEQTNKGPGNVSKTHNYVKTLRAAIALDLRHPKKHGIKMQAHHVLSAEGIKKTNLGTELEHCGYDINHLKNLVFIPSTLQGACHLGVQPHRSNHIAIPTKPVGEKDEIKDEIDEGKHLPPYHDQVKRRVRELARSLKNACQGQPGKNREIIRAMNIRSEDILDGIQNDPEAVPLTRVAANFVKGSHKGCAGKDNIPNVADDDCPVGRDHFGKHGKDQKGEEISMPKPAIPYQLKVGR